MPAIDIPGVGQVDFPDTMSDQAIAGVAARMHGGGPSLMAAHQPARPSAAPAGDPGIIGRLPDLVHGAVEAIPSAAAMGGEVLGGLGAAAAGLETGPGAVALGMAGKTAGGAAGGYVGRMARNAIASTSYGQAAGLTRPSSITEGAGKEAAIQGGASAIGAPLGAGAERVGSALTGSGLKRASAVAEDAARSAPARVSTSRLLDGIRVLEHEAAALGSKEVEAVRAMRDNFLSNKPPRVAAQAVHDIRQAADNVAQEIMTKRSQGLPVGPKLALKGRFYEKVANNARGWLKDNVPGYREAMGEASSAISDMQKVPRVAAGPIHPSVTNLMGGTELLGRAIGNPKALASYGRVLEHPATTDALSQAPRGLALLLHEMASAGSSR